MPKKPKYYVRPDGLHETIKIINGKRKAFRGRSDAEVDRKLLEYKGEVERGKPFKEIAEAWEKAHLPTLAPNTLKGYKPALQRAIDEFGDTPIRQIKATDIKAYLKSFAKQGRAKKTVSTQLLVINLICSYAVEEVEEGGLDHNPCAEVSIPKGLSQKKREPASQEDEERVKKSADIWLLPFLILYTGLRKGEALALTYGDIDKKNAEIKINKSIYYVGDKPNIKMPKTPAGNRIVPLLDPLKKAIPKGKDGQYIFSDNEGTAPLTHRRYDTLWKQYVKKTGITATAHQLRHSYATMLFECGVEAKDAQDLLGHAQISTTNDIYTHIRESRRKKTAKQLSEFITAQNTENTQES